MAKKKGLPKYGEMVLCTTTRITPFAAWCNLDEYENEDGSNVEGMIHISQVAGKWVKDIRDFIKPNKQYIAKVIRIDYEKMHINLSIKRVSKFDKKEKMENYRKGKRSEGMLKQAAKRLGKSWEDAKKEVIKKLESAEKEDGKFDLFDFFEEANENPKLLKEAGLTKDWRDALEEIIQRAFIVKERTLKAILKIETTAPDGVEIIKKVLADLDKGDIDVKSLSSPEYRVSIKSKDPKQAVKDLTDGLDKAVKKIEKAGGSGSYEMVK